MSVRYKNSDIVTLFSEVVLFVAVV